MNFILEQILYFIINFIINPIGFLNKLNEINNLPFGREVKRIEIKDNVIYKYYRNKQLYYKNINYYQIMKNFNFIPRNIKYVDNECLIIQEYKGRLLRENDLNNDIKIKLNKIKKELLDNKIIISDIKPLFFNKNIYNNITIQDNELFIIDYGNMIIKYP